jgi:hypothetical protein
MDSCFRRNDKNTINFNIPKMNKKYDLIGDIHGYADELEALLLKIGSNL